MDRAEWARTAPGEINLGGGPGWTVRTVERTAPRLIDKQCPSENRTQVDSRGKHTEVDSRPISSNRISREAARLIDGQGRVGSDGRGRNQPWRAPAAHCCTLKDMSAAVKEILEAALKLESQQREELIEELSASLDATDLGAYWEAEIKRRIDDVDAGRMKTVPAEEVFARLEQRFRGK